MEKINIAELLKDCPKGMELDCLLYDNVTFDRFDVEQNRCYFKAGPADIFWTTCYGKINGSPFGKCVIFPKGKTTWEGFVPPCKFKDGDVLVHTQNERFIMSIYKSNENEKLINTHVIFWDREEGLSVGMQICCYTDSVRFATKEEKQKLFDAIKENGYKWNPDTKTLEKLIKPKFKSGDKIVKKNGISVPVEITSIGDEYYYSNTYSSVGVLPIKDQDDWELVVDKFDISTLKPFDKVLMRSSNAREWVGTIYSHYSNNKFYGCGMCCDQCIPYEENQHLLGTTNDCIEYYKTW